MSMHDLLSNLPSVKIQSESGDLTRAVTSVERFTAALDELINCRTLASATSISIGEDTRALSSHGLALAELYGTDDRYERGFFGLHALLHDDTSRRWLLLSTDLAPDEPEYASVSRYVMAADWYERSLADMFGIMAESHPDMRRLVHHSQTPLGIYPLRKDFNPEALQEVAHVPAYMQQVAGEGVYEIPLGPIFCGSSGASHFRFNSTGERIMWVEPKGFYAHKGIEKLMEGKTIPEALSVVERIAADASVAHALAFSQAIENMAETTLPLRAKSLRSLFNELERVTGHIHDLSSMGGIGAGYAIMRAEGFRLKERLMQLSDALLQNRFWRGVIVPGGLSRDFTTDELRSVAQTVGEVVDEMRSLLDVAFSSDGLRDRLELTGILRRDAAMVYGAVGVVGRASGVDRDVRRDHPYAAYDRFTPRVITQSSGDVFARFKIRSEELLESRRLITDICTHPGEGEVRVHCHPESGLGIGATEGARGETLHIVYVNNGHISRHVIRDPSFCNLPLVSEIVTANVITDFPLCYQSIGVSHAGCDL